MNVFGKLSNSCRILLGQCRIPFIICNIFESFMWTLFWILWLEVSIVLFISFFYLFLFFLVSVSHINLLFGGLTFEKICRSVQIIPCTPKAARSCLYVYMYNFNGKKNLFYLENGVPYFRYHCVVSDIHSYTHYCTIFIVIL